MEFEVLPTDDNLDRAILTDSVERNKYLFEFYNMLNSDANIGVKTVALDGNWGSGKTFFVKSAILLMNEKSKSRLSEKIEKLLKNSTDEQARNLKKQLTELPDCKLCSFYYDAWLHDSDQYPTLSILNSLCEDKNCHPNTVGVKDIISCLPDVLRPILEKVSVISSFYTIRDTISQVLSKLPENKYNDLLSSVQNIKNTQILMKELLSRVVEELSCEKLVIFIDELDRCNPLYAVKLLEEIKHYYSSEKVLFVFSVNLTQLKNAVNSVYGDSFDSIKYLDRFFDIRLTLPKADVKNFIRKDCGEDENEKILNATIYFVTKNYNFELREIYKYTKVVHFLEDDAIHIKIKKEEEICRQKAYQFVYYVLLPIMIGLKYKDLVLFDDFVNGKNSSPLVEILSDSDMLKILKRIFGSKVVDDENSNFIDRAYQIVFNRSASNEEIVGECTFYCDYDFKPELLSKTCMFQGG